MKELSISSVVVDPGDFPLEEGAPMYSTEFCSWQIHKLLYHLGVQNFKFFQAEDSDWNSVETTLDTFATNIASWIPNAINASAAGQSIPEAPSLPDFVSNGNPPSLLGSIAALAAKIIVWVICKWIEKKLDSTTSTEEGSQALTKIHDLLEHCMTEES
jgi:hypothetical protein